MLAGRWSGRIAAGVIAGALLLSGQVAVAPGGASASVDPLAGGSVDWHDLRQEIDGFGGSGAFEQARRLMAFPQADRRHILDLLFCGEAQPAESAPRDEAGDAVCQASGIDASMIRNIIKVCSFPGYACWASADTDQMWLMREASLRGGARFFSTPWSAPGYMKKNGSPINGGEMKPEFYTAYANYLADYVSTMKQQGLDVEAVSVSNEPEVSVGYDSMNWSGEQFRTFLRDHLRPVFLARGITSKVMLPESVTWSEGKALPTLADPVAERRLDIVAAHGYFSPDARPFATAQEKGKRVWQTEDGDLGANDPSIENAVTWASKIHRYLTQAEVNAWNYWWFVTETSSGESLVSLNPSTNTYSVNKRMYAFGNFSRFIRPGWQRIGVTQPAAASPLVSAYRDPRTGEFAVVTVNDSDEPQALDLRLNGFRAESVVPYTTSATEGLLPGAHVSTASGRLAATLPAQSVTTFVGRGAATSPLHVKVADAVVWNGLRGATDVTVRNAGLTPVSAVVNVAGADSLDPSPGRFDVMLGPGESKTLPVKLTVASTDAATAEYRLDAAARVARPSAPAVLARGAVRYFTTFVDFCPNTPQERLWLHSSDSAVTSGVLSGCLGNPRFADGSASAVYRFELPSDAMGGTLAIDVGNQFLVQTSTDLATWTTAFEERDTSDRARTLGNKMVRMIDLNAVRSGGQVVYLRVADSQPWDGWGAYWTGVGLDLKRPS